MSGVHVLSIVFAFDRATPFAAIELSDLMFE